MPEHEVLSDDPLRFNGASELPRIGVGDDWPALLRGRTRVPLERALPAFLECNRWYAGRQRTLRSVTIEDAVPVASGRNRRAGDELRGRAVDAFLCLLQVEYTDDDGETYVVPLTVAPDSEGEALLADHPNCGVAWLDGRSGQVPQLLYDAMVDPAFAEATLDAFRHRRTFVSPSGAEVRLRTTSDFRKTRATAEDLTPHIPAVEQSNTSVVFGSKLVMKMFRRAQEGVNPDLEMGEFLTDQARVPHTASLRGAMEYTGGKAEPRTLAILNAYVPNEGDAWRYTLDALGLYYERAVAALPDDAVVVPRWSEVLRLAGGDPPPRVLDAIGPYFESVQLLGRRTAELHLALAGAEAESSDAFRPEAFTSQYQRSLLQSMRVQVRPTLTMLRRALRSIEGEEARADAEHVLGAESEILDRFGTLTRHQMDVARIRIHGDFHLGQVLHSGRDFVIIDFEGEPSRSPTERRTKKTGLADVAGMIRSFQYAARTGLDAHAERGLLPHEQVEAYETRERVWQLWTTIGFLGGYLAATRGTALVPPTDEDLHDLLTAYVLDKALYEVRYDLSHRPRWAPIPLHGIVQLLQGTA